MIKVIEESRLTIAFIAQGCALAMAEMIDNKPSKYDELTDGLGQIGVIDTRHGEPAAEGVVAEEEVKHGFLVAVARLPVAVGHGELVEIRQQSQGGLVQRAQGAHGSLFYWPIW